MKEKISRKGRLIMERVNAVLSGVILPVLLPAAAAYFLICFKGRPFYRLFRTLRTGMREKGSSSSLRATAMALAGTLGVGNITGVADAVLKGGPGVLFWMWLSAFAAMIVKYTEILSVMRRRDLPYPRAAGVPMSYMPRAAGAFFSLCGIVCAFSVGSALQTVAVAQSFSAVSRLPAVLPCCLVGAPALFCVMRKKKDLFALTSILIPLFTALYLFFCLAVIVKNADALPPLFARILSEAFRPSAAVSGVSASALTALRYGLIRGLLSNEAGCGTAPIAHAHANVKPEFQARFGVIEVAVDTLLLCSATGLAVLLCPSAATSPSNAVAYALSCVFGGAARLILPSALFCFAFATVLCWSVYLDAFSDHLFSGNARARMLLKIGLCLCCCTAFLFDENLLWQAADLSIALMTIVNVSFLIAERKKLRRGDK